MRPNFGPATDPAQWPAGRWSQRMSQDDLAEEFIQLVPEDAEFEVRAKDVLTVLIDVELSENEVYPKIKTKSQKIHVKKEHMIIHWVVGVPYFRQT